MRLWRIGRSRAYRPVGADSPRHLEKHERHTKKRVDDGDVGEGVFTKHAIFVNVWGRRVYGMGVGVGVATIDVCIEA